ncbi:MAG: hypothetical protein ABJA57_02480 [Ginsengibacter sp.]
MQLLQYRLALHFHRKLVLIASLCFYITIGNAQVTADVTPVSSHEEAIALVSRISSLKPSVVWTNVSPYKFLQNLKENIQRPLDLYEGSNTNFCGYAALSYLPLHDNPVGYIRFMLDLYENGKARYGNVFLNPSDEIKKAAGTLKFKGILDIRPADQMWFLTLADHFKGYVNFFNKHYQPGDENTFWASVNYAKFNRMARKLFNYKVSPRGSDLKHPSIHGLYNYLNKSLQSGITVLYLNNAYLYKKKHNTLRPGIPTHYVILLNIFQPNKNGLITIIYWDYGFRSLRQVSPAFLKKIIFGITHVDKKSANG